MSEDAKNVTPFTKAPAQPRRPFHPMTGNPEAHNYLDFIESLREGEVVPLADRTKTPST